MFCWPVEHVLQGLHSRWPGLLAAAGCFIQPAPISTSSLASRSITIVTVIPISAGITISIISALVLGITHSSYLG